MKLMIGHIFDYRRCLRPASGRLYGFQRRLIYHPSAAIAAPAQYGLDSFRRIFSCPPRAGRPSSYGITPPRRESDPSFIITATPITWATAVIYAAVAQKGSASSPQLTAATAKAPSSPSEQGLYDDASPACISSPSSSMCPLKHIILFGESLHRRRRADGTEYDIGGWCWKRLIHR